MINRGLLTVCEQVDSWCYHNKILYDVVVDDPVIQGLMLYKGTRDDQAKLAEHIRPLLDKEKIHLEARTVRGGSVVALSVAAISENTMHKIISKAGEVIAEQSFEDRLNAAFSDTPPATKSVEAPKPLRQRLAESAKTIVKKSAAEDKPRTRQASPALRCSVFESRLDQVLGGSTSKLDSFNYILSEALDGMATPTGQQPGDLFSKFANALQVLGQSMGTGPLQDVLSQKGIKWKQADDGQSIVLYVINGQTKAPQPIARISSASLEKPNEFETQLFSIIDFAQGDAPGTFKQKQEEFRNQEKAVRDIAKAVGPQDASSVSQQMAQTPGAVAPVQQAAPQGAPTQPQPQVPQVKPVQPIQAAQM